MNTERSLELLQVGCGEWGKLVLRDLVALGARVTTVTGSDRGREHSNRYGATGIFTSIHQAASRSYDGIVVVTPITTHFDVIMECHRAFPGVPIFCEKELVCTVAQALTLQATLGDHLFVMHKWRYHNGILKLKELLQQGTYGSLRSAKLYRLGWGSSQKDVDAIVTAIPHDLSILLELFGEVRTNFRSVTESHSGWVYAQTLVSPGAPSIIIDVSSHSPRTHRGVELYFERAVAVLSDSYDHEISVYVYGDPQDKTPPLPISVPFTPNMPLETELHHFLRYLRGDAPSPKSSVDDSIQIIRALEAIRGYQDT
jgi:predicted dehydrogenase